MWERCQCVMNVSLSIHYPIPQTPGPGTYKIVEPSTYKYKPPKYSMIGRNNMPGDLSRKPGPGTYQPEQVSYIFIILLNLVQYSRYSKNSITTTPLFFINSSDSAKSKCIFFNFASQVLFFHFSHNHFQSLLKKVTT